MCVVGCSSEGTDGCGGDAVDTLEAVSCCIPAVQYNTSDCTCLDKATNSGNYDIKTKMEMSACTQEYMCS